ncbi:Uncharacterised protein [Mycolicibacterium aichiense]|nr:Uncharacterised protein [Mycolicibacterium aichiense]
MMADLETLLLFNFPEEHGKDPTSDCAKKSSPPQGFLD